MTSSSSTNTSSPPHVHHLKLGRTAHRLIAQGSQTVEGRLYSARLARVAVGDILCFNDGMLHTLVTRVTHYPTFRAMVVAEGPAALGEKPDDIDAAVRSYEKIYWYKPDAPQGCLAFAIRVCDPPVGCAPTQFCLWPVSALRADVATQDVRKKG